MKTLLQKLGGKYRQIFRRRRPKHDPMLLLSMSIFNFQDGWSRTFNPLKTHETGAR
jgi:hypothetical protein